jgi:uncharacterized protein (DUF697 family)
MELIANLYVKVQVINVNSNIIIEGIGGNNMVGKRLLKIITLVLIFSIMSGSIVFANGVAGENMRVTEAAGEQQQNELNDESVKVKKEEAVKIAKTILEGAAGFEIAGIYLNPGWGGIESIWNIFYSYRCGTGPV